MYSIQPFSPDEAPLKIDFLIDGQNVGLDNLLKEGSVHFELNKISFAKFTFIANQESTDQENVPINSLNRNSDGTPLNIEVKINYKNNSVTFFKGIIKSLEKQNTDRQIIAKIECKDQGFILTKPNEVNENNTEVFSDRLEKYVANANLTLDQAENYSFLNEVITHNSATVPWDYLVGFLDSVGLMTALRNGEFKTIDIAKPTTEKYVAENGSNVFSFSSKKDAEKIKSLVTIESWDADNQEVRKITSEQDGERNEQNISINQNYQEATMQRIADAIIIKSNLASVYGKVNTYGNLEAKAGDYIGFSKMNADVDDKSLLITSEVHTIENGGWKTEYTFGLETERSFTENTTSGGNNNQAQVGQTNSINGLQIGIVTDIADPENLFRVKVRIPLLAENGEGIWARLATLNASKDMGSYFIPDIGDEVIVGCLGNSPDAPIILGSLYSNYHTPPFTITEDNFLKGFVTKEGTKIVLDDEKKSVEISTQNGNKLTISDDLQGVTIEDENSNKINMDRNGITLESCKDFTVKATGNIKIEGVQTAVEASAIMELKGSLIKLN